MSSSPRATPASTTYRPGDPVTTVPPYRAKVLEAESIAAPATPAPSPPHAARPFTGALREDPPRLDRDTAASLADADNTPAVRLLSDTLREATRRNASDLHIEPAEHGWRIRLRTAYHRTATRPSARCRVGALAHVRDGATGLPEALSATEIA